MKTVDNDPGSCAKQKLDKIVEKLTTKVQAVHYNEVKSTSLSDHNNLVHMIKTKNERCWNQWEDQAAHTWMSLAYQGIGYGDLNDRKRHKGY